MPIGWASSNELNHKIYVCWTSVLRRVYSDKVHNNFPNYIRTTLQLEMHWLSYFANHIIKIEGYDEEKFLNGEIELDKDIKSNGTINEYSIYNCKFVSHRENTIQAVVTRQNDYGDKISKTMKERGTSKGSNNGRAKKIIQYDIYGNYIKTWDYAKQIKETLGYDHSSILKCCKGKQKTAYGYVWKYHKDLLIANGQLKEE